MLTDNGDARDAVEESGDVSRASTNENLCPISAVTDVYDAPAETGSVRKDVQRKRRFLRDQRLVNEEQDD